MNRLAYIAVAWLAVAPTTLSCSHTQTATDRPPPKDTGDSPKRHESKPPKAEGVKQRPDSTTEESGSRDQSHLPLATSPAGLLKPGAAEAIQKALRERGYLPSDQPSGTLDGPTEKALRTFQDDNHLPATGMPDDLTVRKLGLDVADVFKAAPSK